ncbi:hypothetical protein SARC_02504 [Sphaeroforma arctica JP610]|uniref:Uncharacterized protein n=1 Tax=Sphaeroforma arctica JP610 TaxID=667725 RepID=A0A0L0G8F7_9EUKA|nr:hypothetical protein SARC_02504 [Sphaeroforma arctica JP610]KNC85322.1 hypothetical protein SARC_02504 [Sphaeroforma arctica JP610]|eukprot:XP_014159224.1 hypothetical protein SARC_02504 [Sphaeroforma arctica JP610]
MDVDGPQPIPKIDNRLASLTILREFEQRGYVVPGKLVVQKKLLDILTWANYLAFILKKIDLGGLSPAHREQAYRGVILELIENLGRTIELKQLRVKRGSTFAALVEQQVRPTYNNTSTITKYVKATKKKQHELALTRGKFNVKADD